MRTIVYTAAAAKALDHMPAADRSKTVAGIEAYALSGIGDVKVLKGQEGRRLRIGRYRVIFAEDAMTVLAINVLKRDTTTYR
jgi:mRNA interferase RelE/StbE